MAGPRWRRVMASPLMCLLLTVIGAPLVPMGAAGATAAPATLRLGAAPRLPAGAIGLSTLPPGTPLRIDVVMQPRNPAALSSYAREVSTPGSPLYRHFMGEREFSKKFGPTPQAVRSVRNALVAEGLNPGPLSANRLSIPVSGTAGLLGRAFSVSLRQYRLGGDRVAFANTTAPSIPESVSRLVQTVVGLDDLIPPMPAAGATDAIVGRATSGSQVPNGGPEPCGAATAAATASGAYTMDQMATAYGFPALYNTGDFGAGQVIGLVEFAGYKKSDIASYQACYGTDASITPVSVDGGPSPSASVVEADGDIEDALSLAPSANIVVYQAPNTSQAEYDTYNTAVTQDVAKVISTSWLQCEQFVGSGVIAAENTLFEQAAVQGQTILAAAGDSGSEGCLQTFFNGDHPAVDDPASQPFVTGVGGTEWKEAETPPSETVWNDGPRCCSGAGGGGISQMWAMPAYQADASPALDVTNGYSSGTTCGASAGGYCREVPDVSALAGPTPYIFYVNGKWAVYGGTSFATPLWASLIALTDASSSCAGETVGFANPLLYQIASTDPTAFNDIISGDNDLTGTNSGLYPATPGYDMASGLGTPNAAALPSDLCALPGTADPVTVVNPGPQSTDLHQPATLAIDASDETPAQTLTFSALGLPPGLSINPSSGVISGTVTISGLFTVLVTAKDMTGASSSINFTWSIPAAVTKVSPTSGTSGGGTTVTITGTGLSGATGVLFGTTPAQSFTVNSAGTVVTAVSPAQLPGVVKITVVSPGGTSPTTTADRFTYVLVAPDVTGVSPTTGPVDEGTTGTDKNGPVPHRQHDGQTRCRGHFVDHGLDSLLLAPLIGETDFPVLPFDAFMRLWIPDVGPAVTGRRQPRPTALVRDVSCVTGWPAYREAHDRQAAERP